jgi:peptide/nickel transport system permease protein
MATGAVSIRTMAAPSPATLSADAWQRFRRSRLAMAGLALVALLVVAAAGAPWLAPADPAKQSLVEKRTRPGGKFLLGADEFGRDILSRVIHGSRVALLVGLVSVAIALGLALTLGCVAGFAGGWIDVVIMRIVEVLLAFPYLLLAIAVVSALGPGVLNTTIAVGIWGTPTATRLVRGAVLTAREAEYVRAAWALGASAGRVLTRHVLRNILPTVIVYSTLFMANAILVEAALSFLGLGVQPPTPSWGLMVSSGRDFLLVAPHIATVPGLAIMVAVLGFNLLGDGLRDALDPRLRGQL